jgi:type IVB pilus formation R64 PilN family outer membrane protein
MQAKTKMKQEGRMTVINSNFIGDTPIELPYAASLPPIFFEKIVIRSKFSEYGTVSQAAKNIALATGLAVRVNPDVTLKIGAAQVQTQANTNSAITALHQGAITTLSGDISSDHIIRLNAQGTLLSYVKEVANTAGIEWDYKDGAIHFYKLVTKTLQMSSVNPGDIDVSDVMSKGGQATTGQAGGLNATTSGNFNNATSVGTKGSYSIWKSIRPALESALSPSGKLAINEGSGTITVTDTKDAVAKVTQIVDNENAILTKQVAVEVRVIRVDVTKQTDLGLNLNTVYSRLKNGSSALDVSTTSQTSLVSGSVGTMTFTVNDADSKFYGTKAGLQALNQFGDILSDSTSSVITTNRIPVMTGNFTTRGFLAQTTPAAGGSISGGAGVPGLIPGSTTTGSFMRVMPTIKESNTILLNLSVDISDLLGFGSATTGSGTTLQQIQWANTSGTKTISNIQLNQGESMVLAGIGTDTATSNLGVGVAGASSVTSKSKTMFIVIVTPRILKGL